MDIVGLGCVSSIGIGLPSLHQSARQKPVLPATEFTAPSLVDTLFYQGDIKDETARSGFELARIAIEHAVLDSAIDASDLSLVLATGAGDTQSLESHPEHGDSAYSLARRLTEKLKIGGVFCTVSNGCSSAGYALEVASGLLDNGHKAVILCGVECKSNTSQATFKSLLALDPVSCRPFENDRRGTVLGCGAAALVLTAAGNAPGHSYATVLGSALSCDAYHSTAPDPAGTQIMRSMSEVLDKCNVVADDVDFFVPHATGTRLNDDIEHRLLEEKFPGKFTPASTYLLKKYIGHTGGASAAFSYLAAALTIRDADLDTTTGRKRKHYALVNCTAFGGSNSSTLISSSESTARLAA